MLRCITARLMYNVHIHKRAVILSGFQCVTAKGGHGREDKKTQRPTHYLSPRQSANTQHRSEKKKGDYNRQEEEKRHFCQSCVDNFPGADLAKEAASVEHQRQPLGRFALL